MLQVAKENWKLLAVLIAIILFLLVSLIRSIFHFNKMKRDGDVLIKDVNENLMEDLRQYLLKKSHKN